MRRACWAGRCGSAGRAFRAFPTPIAGPAFTTLVGLALFAASDELDLRSVMSPERIMPRETGGNIVQRLISAVRSGF